MTPERIEGPVQRPPPLGGQRPSVCSSHRILQRHRSVAHVAERHLGPRGQVGAKLFEEITSVLLRLTRPPQELGRGAPAQRLEVETQPVARRLEARPALLQQPDLLLERDRGLRQLRAERLVRQRLQAHAVARAVQPVDPRHQCGVTDLLLLGPGEVGMEAAREPAVERLRICRGRELRDRLLVGVLGLPRLPVKLAGALSLHPAGPGGALARRGVLEHLRPALELPHDRGDAVNEALRVGELGPVPDLERRELAPERLALQLELGHLVAERLERGEEALQPLTERRRREDDGCGSSVGHGDGEPGVYRTSPPCPSTAVVADPADEVTHRLEWPPVTRRLSARSTRPCGLAVLDLRRRRSAASGRLGTRRRGRRGVRDRGLGPGGRRTGSDLGAGRRHRTEDGTLTCQSSPKARASRADYRAARPSPRA